MEGKISRLDNLGEQEIEETGDENYMEAYGTACILLLLLLVMGFEYIHTRSTL